MYSNHNSVAAIAISPTKMTDDLMSSPATWTRKDVVSWAEEAKLAPETISALSQNHVDGPTLVTLTKAELQSELGIASLPARRYLWELIKSLRSEQETSDYSTAIQAHEEEILVFASSGTASMNDGGPDTASGGSTGQFSFSAVVNELTTEAQRQRQLVEDHLMAHRMQRAMKLGQQVYEDVEAARSEQLRLNQLLVQAEHDRQYAESLATGIERRAIDARRRQEPQQPESTSNEPDNTARREGQNRFASLFGLCVQSCVENKVDVAEAFRTGKVQPIAIAIADTDEEDRTMPVTNEPSSSLRDVEDYRKPPAASMPFDSLPYMEQCNVCYDENKRGFTLACGHVQCISCTRKLFKAALRDNSLLPLRCCEAPLDMNIAAHLLPREDANIILQRVKEIEAKNKMYCPSCSAFLNLDLVDSTFATDLLCGCGIALCMVCKTSAHPGLSCSENQFGDPGLDESILKLSREEGWKQCPSCSSMIELRYGCNHMTCAHCRHEFCFNCLQQWNASNAQCSSGRCELWDEDRLIEAGEARVQQEEAARGVALPQPVRQERLRFAVAGLRANEICDHDWVRIQGYHGECPNCSFEMYAYGMWCRSDCGATVCHTCAHHRIPQRGWR
jgi:hypothetical protein